MAKQKDQPIVDHVAQKLYDNRFSDDRFLHHTKSWRDMKMFDPPFAECYLDSARVAVKAVREFKSN
jgi:hypothetical protein